MHVTVNRTAIMLVFIVWRAFAGWLVVAGPRPLLGSQPGTLVPKQHRGTAAPPGIDRRRRCPATLASPTPGARPVSSPTAPAAVASRGVRCLPWGTSCWSPGVAVARDRLAGSGVRPGHRPGVGAGVGLDPDPHTDPWTGQQARSPLGQDDRPREAHRPFRGRVRVTEIDPVDPVVPVPGTGVGKYPAAG